MSISRVQVFGRYELVRRISSGGMAEVFEAIHVPSRTRVALKRILPEISEDEEFIKMFEDEARIASQLEHPYIARCLDFGCVEDGWYIAFEYVSGRDLRTIFDRASKSGEPPPVWFIVQVASRIAEGLAYAHARKDDSGQPVSIVHRDVSPQNIIVSYDGDAKLIDFGIAKAAGKLSRTQVGAIKGKFGYMSPEQIAGEEVDQRADIFSLGICMWELLTSRRLFDGHNELAVLEKIRSKTVEPPSRHRPDVPPELDRAVLKALAKNLDERYRAAKELYRDLNHLAQSNNLVATREQIAQYMRRSFPERPRQHDPHDRPSAVPGEGSPTTSRRPATQVQATGTPGWQQVQESRVMGAENKGGSDLDIFEGLGKKSSARPSAAPSSNGPQNGGAPRTAPPPPPGGDPAKKTLLGIQSPASQSSIPAARISAAPPPPPGRGSLPQISAPPPKPSTSGMPSVVPPPAVSTRPAPLPPSAPPPAPAPVAHAGANATDMDWDDEDEATHVFDKSDLELPAKQSIRPAAGMPTPAPAPINNKQTLLGITAPLQAPPPAPPPPPASSQAPPARMSAPPPPPPSSVGAFARQSGMPGGFPPPPTINPIPSPPPTQQGIGPASLQGQTSTVPLPMPKQASLPPPAGAPNAASHGFPGTAPLPPAHAQDFRAPRSMEQTAVVRPPASKTGLWIGLAAVVALLGLGAIMFSMMMPKNGRIVVNVADAKGGSIPLVQVFVDGKKQCDATPCIADKQEAGSHAVKVIAQGYESPADQTITVEAHKDASVTFTLSSATKKTGTGLRVAGNQTGVKLFIDNKEVGPLPQELLDLTPGDHSVKIAGTERYAPVEKNVIIAKDEILDMGPTTLKVVKGKATINLNTPGARVYLVSGDDRRELPKFPISVDIDTSKSWSLEASKVGYQDYKQPISFDDGQAERTYNVELPLKGAPAPTTTATTPPPPVAQTAAPPVAPAPTPAPTPTTPPAATPVAAVGEAYLNINSIPPSSVFLDGVPLGMTPKIHQPVKPGSHRVKFMHPEAGTKEISVSVAAGETKPAVLKLQ